MTPLAAALQVAIDKIQVCKTCGNIDTQNPCTVCTDPRRDPATIVVVADVADLWALERANATNGLYHVLGGTLSPLDGVGPQDLTIDALVARAHDAQVSEIILALECDGRRPDHRALHHRPAAGRQRQGDPACAWRAGRRRTRLSRRRHAVRRDAAAHAVLTHQTELIDMTKRRFGKRSALRHAICARGVALRLPHGRSRPSLRAEARQADQRRRRAVGRTQRHEGARRQARASASPPTRSPANRAGCRRRTGSAIWRPGRRPSSSSPPATRRPRS